MENNTKIMEQIMERSKKNNGVGFIDYFTWHIRYAASKGFLHHVYNLATIGVFAGLFTLALTRHPPPVQKDYVARSNLEVLITDNDKNGEFETILKIDGKSYHLKYDQQNKPHLQPFETKPIEIK